MATKDREETREETREEKEGEEKRRFTVAPGAGSYESKCPICLEEYDNKAFVNVCFHAFCYVCILQWSEVSDKCPMCKVAFQSLIHSVISNSNYKTHRLNPPSKKTPSNEVNINEARRRFRYRTTVLPGESQPQEGVRHRNIQSRKPATEERRKTVYQSGMRALPLITEDKKIRIRDISASFFKSHPAATHRLLPWLSRDIRVTLGGEHVEFIIQMIMSLIDKIDIESVEFKDHMRPFFHDKTDHFIHEFISFAKSPLDMTAYDHKVSYGLPLKIREEQERDSHLIDQPGPSGISSQNQLQSSQNQLESSQNQALQSLNPSDSPSYSKSIQERVLYELSTTTWDDSPIMTTLQTTPPQAAHCDSNDSIIYIDSSSDDNGVTIYSTKTSAINSNSKGTTKSVTKNSTRSKGKKTRVSTTKEGHSNELLQVNEVSCSKERGKRRKGKGKEKARYHHRECSPSYSSSYNYTSSDYYTDSDSSIDSHRGRKRSYERSQQKSREYSHYRKRSSRRSSERSNSREKKVRDSKRKELHHRSNNSCDDKYHRKTRHISTKKSSSKANCKRDRSRDSSHHRRSRSHDHKTKSQDYSKRSHDQSHDYTSRSHDHRTKSHDSRSHDYYGYSDESYEDKRYHSSRRRSSGDKRQRPHSRHNDSHHHQYKDHSSDLEHISSSSINAELKSIDDNLIEMKQKLLKGLLHKERTTLLKRALRKELQNEQNKDRREEEISYSSEGEDSDSSTTEELVQELREVEREIREGKRKVLAVAKKIELTKQEETSE